MDLFQILTDMEESQISVLPPELAAEAQNLRRDWESRNRQMMQMRLLNQIGTSANFHSLFRHRSKYFCIFITNTSTFSYDFVFISFM